jgi:hypothetical protein
MDAILNERGEVIRFMPILPPEKHRQFRDILK